AFRSFAQFPLQKYREAREQDRHDEPDADAVDDPEPIDQITADDRCDHNRHALDNRLQTDTHRVAIRAEAGADEREAGGQGKTGPGEKKKHAGNDRAPMRHEKNHRVTRDREKVEGEKSAPMSPAIHEYAAG